VLVGLIALVVVLAASSAAGFALRRRQGRFRSQSTTGIGKRDQGDARPPSASSDSGLAPQELGAPLGERATLVQFSTEVCAYCGPVRELLTEVARERDGVAFVEIDAAARIDLTRRLRVLSTPTVLVLDAAGGIASRASGPVRKADLVTALGQVLRPGGEMHAGW
jgi:hypothetical protein